MILIINCGSQSIKWKLFSNDLKLVKKNKLEIFDTSEHREIIKEELVKLKDSGVEMIGHRVVHGKDVFKEPTKITEENLKKMEGLNYLAPLHNPYNILGIKTCQEIFSEVDNFAVFDTEFFKTLPERAYAYALPEKIVKELGFRRYGFHGISHEYVARKAAAQVKKPFEKLKIITCHLGGGASITAIKNGKALDTSMGFTPMQGLVMMTRAGDMDHGIVLGMMKNFGLEKTTEILNKESGIKGICGEGDMLKVLQIINNKKTENHERSQRAKLALDVFVYSIQKYIGSYSAILGSCDVLAFTGAIGYGSAKIRNMICKDLKILTNTKILAIETDEELAIAEKIAKFK